MRYIKKELNKPEYDLTSEQVEKIAALFKSYVKEVIGEDEKPTSNRSVSLTFAGSRNSLRYELKKAFGIEE